MHYALYVHCACARPSLSLVSWFCGSVTLCRRSGVLRWSTGRTREYCLLTVAALSSLARLGIGYRGGQRATGEIAHLDMRTPDPATRVWSGGKRRHATPKALSLGRGAVHTQAACLQCAPSRRAPDAHGMPHGLPPLWPCHTYHAPPASTRCRTSYRARTHHHCCRGSPRACYTQDQHTLCGSASREYSSRPRDATPITHTYRVCAPTRAPLALHITRPAARPRLGSGGGTVGHDIPQ